MSVAHNTGQVEITALEKAWREYLERTPGSRNVDGRPFETFANTRDSWTAGYAAAADQIIQTVVKAGLTVETAPAQPAPLGPSGKPLPSAWPTDEFMECDICRAKPGSPPLCVACLHNRTLIDSLKRALKR
jgi:hypothetical protein